MCFRIIKLVMVKYKKIFGGISLKKRNLLIIFLVISLLFGAYTFFMQMQKKQAANEIFKGCLSKAKGCFSMDYTKLDENTKDYYYIDACSNLYTAMNILEFTSYENVGNKNQDLVSAMYELYRCMTIQSKPESNNRWIAVTKREEEISKCLDYISMNPNDKDSCKELVKIVGEIGY